MLTNHHQRIGHKCAAGTHTYMYACKHAVALHVTMRRCSLGAQMLTCVLVQRLHVQVAPHCECQLFYRLRCIASGEALELPVPFIVVHFS